MLRRTWRNLFLVVLFLLVASCSGGGCSSGCGGCGGSTPLPGGFPRDRAIQNAASVRVTRPGLDFIATAMPAVAGKAAGATGGVLGVDIPKTDPAKTSIANLGIGELFIDPIVCPDGPKASPPQCKVTVNLGNSTFKLDAVTPNSVVLRGVIPIKVDDTPIGATLSAKPIFLPSFDIGSLTIHIGYGNGSCSGGVPNVTPHALPVTVTIPLIAETIAPRDGYTKIDVNAAVIDFTLDNGKVQVCSNCGFATDVCSAITNSGFVKDLVLNPIKSGLQDQVKGLLEDQLCTAPNPALNPPCPTGSKPDAGNKKCVYNSKTTSCVPTLLGTDMHLDLSGALKSISPGTSGGLDFGLAAGGDMQPFPKAPADNTPYQGHTPNGITLGMLGGALPQPQSNCVPVANLQVPTGIPIPDEITVDKLTPWPSGDTGPHMGIALAGRFLNYSMGSVYNSGLLCLGITTQQIPQINSALLSVLIPSIKTLTFEQRAASVAITTRPQTPPTIKIGGGKDIKTDPLLAIQMNRFGVDFYIWSYDRFVRAFTFEGDITVPLNLSTAKSAKNTNGGLQPVLGDLSIANGKVTNAETLTDDPAKIASALSSILGGLGGQLVGGGINPIDLSGALKSFGLGLTIPDGGVRKLSKGSDDYLGIFMNLSTLPGAATMEVDTEAKLVSKIVDTSAMTFEGYDRGRIPRLAIEMSSPMDDGVTPIEYSWSIDQGTRSAWTREKKVTIQEDILFFQAKHTLQVSARLVGQPETEDSSPVVIPFAIDALAPFAQVKVESGAFTVSAWDIVSDSAALRGRYRLGGGEWSEWGPLERLEKVDGQGKREVTVEVRDEEGNVVTVTERLIRGVADPTLAAAGGGCGCSTPGQTGGVGPLGVLAGIAGVLALGLRGLGRRGRSGLLGLLGLGSITAVASTSQGCACGSEEGGQTGCGADCNSPCQDGLPRGVVGSYLSVAKAKDNTIWVAAYNDAVLSDGDFRLYGDLVVGKYDLGKQAVDWKTADGLPPPRTDGTCTDNDPRGWRKGETESGDNVGLWTSLALGKDETPMVSYHDVTRSALKFAVLDGNAWRAHTIKHGASADYGRYSKTIVVDGKPVVAFLAMEPGNAGRMRSKVTIARATEELPKADSAWKFEDAAIIEDSPCRASTCKSNEACVKATGICQSKVAGCTPADCGTGKACVTIDKKSACSDIIDQASVETYPNTFGAYISLAKGPQGLGMVVYDRTHGNLVALANVGGGWQQTILDGETGSRKDKTAVDTGDVGAGASLFIDGAGTWHVTYVNGIDETLRYVQLAGGKPTKSEVVDDGLGLDGKPFPDGRHIVGDDSFVQVEPSGSISVFYQDATAGTLRSASGVAQGATRKWTSKLVAQPGKFAGFFPKGVDGKIANFWRQTNRTTKEITGDVSIVGMP